MSPILYLLAAICLIVVLFAVVRRPMYEVILSVFLIMSIVSGNLSKVPSYCFTTAKNYLLYAIIAFIAFSAVMNKTGVIDEFLDIIISVAGRFPGGAGYVSIIASSIMGALSGSAPGNAASIGSITIPAMKKTGFSAELAAAVGTASSSLGPLLPPSGAIITAYGFLVALYPEACTLSQFWIIMWGIGLWLILQRFITLFFYVRHNHIGAIPPDERPRFAESVKKGWKTLLLPLIILLPFMLDSTLTPFYQRQLGAEGASILSKSLLVIVPSIASAYTLLIAKNKSVFDAKKYRDFFVETIEQISPVAVMVFAGFAFGELFSDIGVGKAIASVLAGSNISKWVVIFVVPLIWAVLGMFLEPLVILFMIGEAVIALAASVGINPILMAGVSIAIGHVMANMTPPFATTFFVSVGIANADFAQTTKIITVWCVIQYLFIILMLSGILPVLGLIPFTS